MTMPIRREWLAPGILIAVLTIITNVASTWAVDRYRTDGTERALNALRSEVREQNTETKESIGNINHRLDQMQRDSTEMIRLQERNEQLKDAITSMRSDFTALREALEVTNMQAQKFREELYRKGVL